MPKRSRFDIEREEEEKNSLKKDVASRGIPQEFINDAFASRYHDIDRTKVLEIVGLIHKAINDINIQNLQIQQLKDLSFFTSILGDRYIKTNFNLFYDNKSKNIEIISDAYRNNILRSVSGMQSGKGIMPRQEDINNLKLWCSIDGQLDMSLLRSITGMQHAKASRYK